MAIYGLAASVPVAYGAAVYMLAVDVLTIYSPPIYVLIVYALPGCYLVKRTVTLAVATGLSMPIRVPRPLMAPNLPFTVKSQQNVLAATVADEPAGSRAQVPGRPVIRRNVAAGRATWV